MASNLARATSSFWVGGRGGLEQKVGLGMDIPIRLICARISWQLGHWDGLGVKIDIFQTLIA